MVAQNERSGPDVPHGKDSHEKLLADVTDSLVKARLNPGEMEDWRVQQRPLFERRAKKLGVDPKELLAKAWRS